MRRIKNGWKLTKKSWRVLADDPNLIRFPIYGGLVGLLLVIVLIVPGVYLIEEGPEAAGIVLVAIGGYLIAFATYFYAVGLAATADRKMSGEQADVGYGIGVARSRMSQVAGWALVATVVSWVIRAVQENGVLGALLGSAIAVGWALISFLAVPVIAIEGLGPIATLKRSASLFRGRWGEQVTGNIAIGGALFLICFLPGAFCVLGGILLWEDSAIGGGALAVVGILIFITGALVQQALTAIFGVALYRYTADGKAVGGFSQDEIETAVRSKRGGNLGGPAPTTV